MIEEIRIGSLGVISEAVLPLGPGFTAITGETGAGKTMVVTALGLLRGERADAAVVRSGQENAWVEGRWLVGEAEAASVLSIVTEAGGSVDDNELLLGRSVSREGRSRAVVGGRSTPIATLGDLGGLLVAVHGQSDQVRLRSSSAQRQALDRFAGARLAEIASEYAHAYRRWRDNQAELDLLTSARDAREREAADLRAALSEIEAVAPQPGEDVALAELSQRLTNTEELRAATSIARDALSGESDEGPDALARVELARRQLERLSSVDARLDEIGTLLGEVGALLSDAVSQLSRHLADLEGDSEYNLDQLHERRAEISSLVRKYGPTLDDVLDLMSTGATRLAELDGDDDRIAELQGEVVADEELVRRGASAIHDIRVAAGKQLAQAVTTELAALAMPTAQLHVEVTEVPELSVHGGDSVEILLRPHPGAEPRPIAKGASGGELSRIMLALEVVISGEDRVPTYVFDEIDAGVGGAAAIEIGRRLARLAEQAQVIVVTHLAQVAAFATNHLSVVKDTSGEVTASSVLRLEGEARVAEMARLLSGLPDSESGLAHARELIQLASSR